MVFWIDSTKIIDVIPINRHNSLCIKLVTIHENKILRNYNAYYYSDNIITKICNKNGSIHYVVKITVDKFMKDLRDCICKIHCSDLYNLETFDHIIYRILS